MAIIGGDSFRDGLLERRRKVQQAIDLGGDAARFGHLLTDIDTALARLESEMFGICEACDEPIEIERLAGNPLLRTCLDHLTADERRALEDDLELAARIQGRLLPERRLAVSGWEANYQYVPAGAVGGDYCDLVPAVQNGGGFYFLLGDVAGKGLSASLLMASLRAIVRTLVEAGLPVSTLVERANRLFCETALPQHYATLVCGKASATGEIEICNAGHPPPLLARGAEVSRLGATGLPIGMFSSGDYPARKFTLGPGETLLLYTDGLSESRGPSGEEYGVDRLVATLSKRRDLAPGDLVAACLEDAAAFRTGVARADDLTVLAIRRSGQN